MVELDGTEQPIDISLSVNLCNTDSVFWWVYRPNIVRASDFGRHSCCLWKTSAREGSHKYRFVKYRYSITALSAYLPTHHVICSGRTIHLKADTPCHDGLWFDSTRRIVLVSGPGLARVSQSPEEKEACARKDSEHFLLLLSSRSSLPLTCIWVGVS